jgi:hypothetical protein
MIRHFENIKYLYGSSANVRLPNSIFKDLSDSIKTNGQQVAFAYVYCVTVAFLYKYAQFVDIDNSTYIQNADIKELLGYNRTTKTVDKIIKKNGVLDELGLTSTTRDFPVDFIKNSENIGINTIPIREFITFSELDANGINYTLIKQIVKNRNYEVKEPLFLTTGYEENEFGTLYSIERTHQITIDEFLCFIKNNDLNNIDFLLYAFLKYKCKGFEDNMRSMTLNYILSELGMNADTFYNHLKAVKEKGLVDVSHKGWKTVGKNLEANDYYWVGLK